MLRGKSLLLPVFLVLQLFCTAQKSYQISRVGERPIIDGKSTDIAWQKVPIATDFIQQLPNPLQPSLYKTEVKLCYDNDAIYILAINYQPKATQLMQLCERDNIGNTNVDNFGVYFDTYNDKQNGYSFKVTSAGVQQDERLLNGGSPNGNPGGDQADISWDAVWNSAVKSSDDRWIVEMEIPFSAIRNPTAPLQTWGLNFRRTMRKDNETSFWNTFDQNKSGFLLQEGQLTGLENLQTPLRLFLFPYLNSGIQSNPTNNGRDYDWSRAGGLDIKYGINDAFTLDATLIPDFSQVISDNIIRNLSPFEQQLNENRPFFTEGVELFTKQNMFYSRRVGERPDGYYDAENIFGDGNKYKIEKNPNVSNLYNAFKISGRTKQNLGVGIFNAVQAPMSAKVIDIATGKDTTYQTSPLTNYNMIVFDKALKGQNNLNFSNTNVLRANGQRNANVSGILGNFFFKENTYNLGFNVKNSLVSDPNGGKVSAGQYVSASVGKVGGKFRYSLNQVYWTPKYDQTDMGIQFDFNSGSQNLSFSWNNNEPKFKKLQAFNTWFNQTLEQNLKPFRFRSYEYEGGFFFLFKNFVDISLFYGGKPFQHYNFYQMSRFGISLRDYGYNWVSFQGSTDSRKKLFAYFGGSYGGNRQRRDLDYFDGNFGLRYNIGDHWSIESGINAVRGEGNVGRTVEYFEVDSAIVSHRLVNEYTWEVKAKYNINPILSINGRYRHYNNIVNNKGFYLLEEGSLWDKNPLPYREGQNENFNLANIDLFMNWIFRPGSRLIVSYKQWLPNEYILNDQFGINTFGQNVYESWSARKSFVLTGRVIWFLDYNKLRKKKA